MRKAIHFNNFDGNPNEYCKMENKKREHLHFECGMNEPEKHTHTPYTLKRLNTNINFNIKIVRILFNVNGDWRECISKRERERER